MDKRLFFLMNKAHHKLFNYVDKACEDAMGTSVTQLAALMFVVKNSGCKQKDIAKEFSQNKSAITGLINRMEKNGLIERKLSAEDARVVQIYPTPEGMEKATQVIPFIKEFNAIFDEEFDEQELETVLKFLNFIMKRF